MATLKIVEIFGPTFQGEGALIGRPTIFVRFGGCDYRCSWCDTMYAVDPRMADTWTAMDEEEILARVNDLGGGLPQLVTLSGGNPAIYDLTGLIQLGHREGHQFALETQGSVPRKWFSDCDYVTLSPKPPSSGQHFNRERFNRCIQDSLGSAVSIKIPLLDQQDLEFAARVRGLYPHLPMIVQPVNLTLDAGKAGEYLHRLSLLDGLTQLARDVLGRQDLLGVQVLPQLHVLMWGNKRGV